MTPENKSNEEIAENIVQSTRFDDEVTDCRRLIKEALDAKDAERIIHVAEIATSEERRRVHLENCQNELAESAKEIERLTKICRESCEDNGCYFGEEVKSLRSHLTILRSALEKIVSEAPDFQNVDLASGICIGIKKIAKDALEKTKEK